MQPEIINHAEAVQYVLSIEDQITRELLSVALKELEVSVIRSEFRPAANFDVLAYVTVLERALSQHDLLRAILSGRSAAWPEYP